jgi:hypothetical protein
LTYEGPADSFGFRTDSPDSVFHIKSTSGPFLHLDPTDTDWRDYSYIFETGKVGSYPYNEYISFKINNHVSDTHQNVWTLKADTGVLSFGDGVVGHGFGSDTKYNFYRRVDDSNSDDEINLMSFTNTESVPSDAAYDQGGLVTGALEAVHARTQRYTGNRDLIAVFGNVVSTGPRKNYGVFGHVSTAENGAYSSENSTNYGIYGHAFGPGANYAVFGDQPSGGEENWAGYFDGETKITGNLTVLGSCSGCSSDISLKGNIQGLSGTLEKLEQVRGVYFDWEPHTTESRDFPGRQIGVVAQELEAVFPELVGTDARGLKFVRYDKLVVPLLTAVKELQARVLELEDRVRDHSTHAN